MGRDILKEKLKNLLKGKGQARNGGDSNNNNITREEEKRKYTGNK